MIAPEQVPPWRKIESCCALYGLDMSDAPGQSASLPLSRFCLLGTGLRKVGSSCAIMVPMLYVSFSVALFSVYGVGGVRSTFVHRFNYNLILPFKLQEFTRTFHLHSQLRDLKGNCPGL
jgi:hypothetical protein